MKKKRPKVDDSTLYVKACRNKYHVYGKIGKREYIITSFNDRLAAERYVAAAQGREGI